MNIQIKTSIHSTWGKAIVAGSVLGKSRGKQVQEHLETIYYLGLVRIIFRYDFKFIIFTT